MNSTSGSMSSKLLNENTPFAIRESFNRLRTNLMYTVNDEGGCPVWGITSANEAVGKSTIIANLAISFCYAGQKVLLVDADMPLHAGGSVRAGKRRKWTERIAFRHCRRRYRRDPSYSGSVA